MTEEVELFAGDLHGYRSWAAKLTEEGVRLTAEYRITDPWTPGKQPKAKCVPRTDSLSWIFNGSHAREHTHGPTPGCWCGYFGYYQHANEKHDNLVPSKDNLRVSGVIRASGMVEMHERGFRAEYAEILAISPPKPAADLPRVSPTVLALLADHYRVPWFPTFEAMAAEFPPTHAEEPKPKPAERPRARGGLVFGGCNCVLCTGNVFSPTATSLWTPPKPSPNTLLADQMKDALARINQAQEELNAMPKKDRKRRFPWITGP